MQILTSVWVCRIDQFLTVYLGMLLGNKHKELEICDGIVDKPERSYQSGKVNTEEELLS